MLTFSAVIDSTLQSGVINIWFKKSGTNIPNSNTRSYVAANGNPVVCTVTMITAFAQGDYVELWTNAAGSFGNGILYAESGSGPVPACPSVIFTANKVSD